MFLMFWVALVLNLFLGGLGFVCLVGFFGLFVFF